MFRLFFQHGALGDGLVELAAFVCTHFLTNFLSARMGAKPTGAGQIAGALPTPPSVVGACVSTSEASQTPTHWQACGSPTEVLVSYPQAASQVPTEMSTPPTTPSFLEALK